MKTWMKKLALAGAVACGALVAACTGGNGGGRVGSEMGYNAAGERVPFERKLNVADQRRAGKTNGMLLGPGGPTIREGSHYGFSPMSGAEAAAASRGQMGVGGSGLPASPAGAPRPGEQGRSR